MAISLKDVEKTYDEDDSLLDIILKKKEKKARLSKGDKPSVMRPWDRSHRENKTRSVKKPFVKNKVEENEVFGKISQRASGIFSDIDINDL